MLSDRERHVLGLARNALIDLGDAGAGPITTNSRAAGKLGEILGVLATAADEDVIDGDAADGPLEAVASTGPSEPTDLELAEQAAEDLADDQKVGAALSVGRLVERLKSRADLAKAIDARPPILINLASGIEDARDRLAAIEARLEAARPAAIDPDLLDRLRRDVRIAEGPGIYATPLKSDLAAAVAALESRAS